MFFSKKDKNKRKWLFRLKGQHEPPFIYKGSLLSTTSMLFCFNNKCIFILTFVKGRMLETLGTNISSTKPLFTIKLD